MCRGGVRSQLNPELQIISPKTFQAAQQVLEQRKQGQRPKKLVGRAHWEMFTAAVVEEGYLHQLFEKLIE